MRTATDILNEMDQLDARKKELLREMRELTPDQAEHYAIWLEIGDIRENLSTLREELQAQLAWDNQNIFERE